MNTWGFVTPWLGNPGQVEIGCICLLSESHFIIVSSQMHLIRLTRALSEAHSGLDSMSPSGRRQKDDSVRIGQTGSCHSLVESLIICSSRGANETWWSGREVRDSPYPSLLTGCLIITAIHSTLFNSLPIKTQENRYSHTSRNGV